jgi:L-threonylcarbamoyladenylate synthase
MDPGDEVDLVHRAAHELRTGHVVAIPTDTVYGFAAAIDRPEAIDRLYAIKGRPAEKAIPVLIADLSHVDRLTPRLTGTAEHLARTFWPGALTLVLPAMPNLPQRVTALSGDGMPTVAVRVPGNALARAIIAAAGGALAVTSANRSGGPPAVEARDVTALELAQPLLIVDGGRAPGGVPSTIVSVTAETPVILREGAIPASSIAAAVARAVAKKEPISEAEAGPRYDQRMMRQNRGDPREATS